MRRFRESQYRCPGLADVGGVRRRAPGPVFGTRRYGADSHTDWPATNQASLTAS